MGDQQEPAAGGKVPAYDYRVVRTLSDGYDDGSITPERQGYSVVIAYPDHPGWWRVIAEFRALNRAMRYAAVENARSLYNCADDERDVDGDVRRTEPEDAPPEPPSRVLARQAAEDRLRLAREELTASKLVAEVLLARVQVLEAERDLAVGRAEKAEAEAREEAAARVEELEAHREEARRLREKIKAAVVSAPAPARAEVPAEVPAEVKILEETPGVVTQPAAPLPLEQELGYRAASTLAAMERLWDAGKHEVVTKDLAAQGIPGGSLTAAFDLLGKRGYVSIDPGIPGEARIRRLLRRADGTEVRRPDMAIEAEVSRETLPALAGLVKASDAEVWNARAATDLKVVGGNVWCEHCGSPMPEGRMGRFCSADCSQEAAREADRARLAAREAVAVGGEVEVRESPPLKVGTLPSVPTSRFNNPFFDAADKVLAKVGGVR